MNFFLRLRQSEHRKYVIAYLLAIVLPSFLQGASVFFMAILALQAIFSKNFSLKNLFREKWMLYPALLYLFMCATAFFPPLGNESKTSFQVFSASLPYILIPLSIFTIVGANRAVLERIIRVFTLSLAASLLIALIYGIVDILVTGSSTLIINLGEYHKLRYYGLTRISSNWHPIYVSLQINLSLLFILFRQSKIFPDRRYDYLLLIFLMVMNILLNSLTGLATMVLILTTWVIRRSLLGTRGAGGLVTGFAMICLLIGSIAFSPSVRDKFNQVVESGIEPTDDYEERSAFSMRLAKWVTYTSIFLDHKYLGTGVNNISPLRKEYYLKRGYEDLALHNYNAHNQYLEILATYGIAGTLLFLLIIGTFLKRVGFRDITPLVFLGTCLLAWTTESMLNRQQGLILFMFYYGLLLAECSGRKENEIPSTLPA